MKTLKLLGLSIHISAFFVIHLPDLASAQVMPGGLKTRVNGSAFGACASGNCAISGGSKSGQNLFHRFNYFDTRNGITKIRLDTQGLENVIVGVTSGSGSFLNKPLTLSSAANLFWLSPGGIWVGSGAGFYNVPNLLLSTGTGIRLGGNSFDVFATTPKDALRLQQQPSFNINESDTEKLEFSDLAEFAGNQSITLQGGLKITIDRNLIIDATGGNLISQPGAEIGLQAGSSVRLSGHQIALRNISISAGSQKGWGLVDIKTNPLASAHGAINLDYLELKGEKLTIAGGEVSLSNSKLEAPKGSILLQATTAGRVGNRLNLFNSTLDVEPHSLDDLYAPLTFRSEQPVIESTIPRPSISLMSSGGISVLQSKLNASLDLFWLQGPQPFVDETMRRLSDVSGEIQLSAGNGGIDVRSSSIISDASHNIAGNIRFLAMNEGPYAGIKVKDTYVSASYGIGQGCIFMESDAGISVVNSFFNSSANRYPLINKKEFFIGVHGNAKPLSFYGGYISLNNTSALYPIMIESSKFYSVKNSEGGPLESGLFGPLGKFVDSNGMSIKEGASSDSLGIEGAKYGSIVAYLAGYQYYYSGGQVRIVSNGGISINQSELNTSSGQPSAKQLENTAGLIALINNNDKMINISDSSLISTTGFSRIQADRYYHPGVILLFNEKGKTLFSNSKLDVSSLTSYLTSVSDIKYPTIFISSKAIDFMGATYMSAKPVKDSAPAVDETKKQTISDGGISLSPLKQSANLLTDPSPFTDEEFNREFLQNIAYKSFAELNQVPLNELKKNLRQVNENPLISRQANTVGPTNLSVINGQKFVESEKESGTREFLKAQQRSLENTAKQLGLAASAGRLYSIKDLQSRLLLAQVISSQPTGLESDTNRKNHPYTPAIVHLQRNDEASGQTRITAILLTAQGEPISRSTRVARADLDGWIKGFQRQLSRRSPQPDPTRDAGEPLAKALVSPLLPLLRAQGVNALLLEVDRGLQAIPYGALPVEGRPLGELFALTITPSLGLIELDPGQRAFRGQLLLAGASQFSNGLAPLPMVRQELQALAREHHSHLLLDNSFTPTALIDQALAGQFNQLHIATHANFLPGQTGVLYTPNTTLSLADLGLRLRSRNSSHPLDLISMSACLTALGDEQSELGFVGMALQAGARSGLGTLWEVDDTATAAFFIELYRFLKVGLTKDQALQATQQAFRLGQVRLQGDRLVGPDPRTGQAQSTLVAGLSREEQILFAQGLNHPYYWAGMILTGSPW
ncbi:MAG: CHAT domain-containing protein [Cyanobacteria bacterium]|nr:CHAT domain-containing protein [Cyanobacteriota bacterium]